MSRDIDDGGPAFPHVRCTIGQNMEERVTDGGMSLRDWFAGQALVGVLSARNGFLVDVGTDNSPEWAYRVADAMLAEHRRKSHKEEIP